MPKLPAVARRSLLAAAGGLAVASLAGSSVPQALATDRLDASHFRLVESERNAGALAKLSRTLPLASLTDVLDSGDRHLAPTTIGLPHEARAWQWTDDDATTTEWYPQGITGNYDADGRDTVDGRSVLLVSWYHADDVQGARLTFIDATDPGRPRYRHVLLVEPFVDADGRGDYRIVPVHAGGVVWYGHWLHLADTWNGLRVFDLRRLWRTDTDRPDTIGRQADGSHQAYGHPFVLPQALHLTSEVTGGLSRVRFSAVSLDRTSTPHSLVVAEYRNSADQAAGQGSRLIRYPLNSVTGLPLASDGVSVAVEAHDVNTNSMQSATALHGTFVISRSAGTTANGHLVTVTPPAEPVWYRSHFPVGCEDLTTWGSRDELWTLAEHPGQRSIVAVRPSGYGLASA